MDLSIVIVNWNSVEFVLDCVSSIQASVHELDYEIVIVDNASQDDPSSVLAARFPSLKLLRSDRNIGFAGANNIGAELSHGNKILFLNPDTIVLGNAIQTMSASLDAAATIGAVGCRLLNRDMTVQTSCVQRFPTIVNQLFGLECLRRFLPAAPLWGMGPLFLKDSGGSCEVEVVSGAALMVRRQAFEEVGRFSTDYFLYAEEADLCHKFRRRGWKIYHVGDAKIVHFGGQSTRKISNASSEVIMRDSVFRLLCKFRGRTYAHFYRIALFSGAVIRLIALTPLLAIPNCSLGPDSVRDVFRKWCRIASWAVSLRGRPRELYSSPSRTAVPSI